MNEACVIAVLSTLARYELNYESSPFSIDDANDFETHLIGVTTVIKYAEYHVNRSKLVIWSRRLMNAQNIEYVKDLYLE